jgi:hypothetical protein
MMNPRIIKVRVEVVFAGARVGQGAVALCVYEGILSGGEVNWLVDGPFGERLLSVDLAHVDLTGGEQRREQHGGSLC